MSVPFERATTENAPSSRSIAPATASSSGASPFAIRAAITSVSEVVPERDALGRELVAQGGRVDEVAVVPESDGAAAAALDQRLGVGPLGRAGGRVARVADRRVAVQAAQLLFVEDLGDEAHVAQHRQAAVVRDGDPGRLLAAVLEREEPEEGDARDVALRRADAEDAAHQATIPSSGSCGQSGSPPARITEP